MPTFDKFPVGDTIYPDPSPLDFLIGGLNALKLTFMCSSEGQACDDLVLHRDDILYSHVNVWKGGATVGNPAFD